MNKKKQKHLSIKSLVLSILSAAVGIQNKNALERDFEQDNPWPFIIGGLIFTAVFLGALIFIVKLVLS